MRKKKILRPRPTMCATCPFRQEGYTEVRGLLVERALSTGTPICHSTGESDIVENPTWPPMACRGARDLQLNLLASLGFLESPTDEAWENKALQLGLR